MAFASYPAPTFGAFMKAKRIFFAVGVSAFAFGGGATANPITALAQTATSVGSASSPAASRRASPADLTFVEKASVGGEKEVAAGKLALERSNNADIKKFAQMMVDDHTKAGAELESIAKSEGAVPKGDPKVKAEAELTKLKSLSGAAFDKAYVDTMHADHVKTVELFQAEATKGSSPPLKGFAEATLPTLKKHLEHVKTLQK